MIRNYYNKKLNKFISPILFDVSLRDGLQGLSTEIMESFTLNNKKNIFHNIMFNYKPKNIEIGSIVNPKLLPIMEDSLELFYYTRDYINNIAISPTNIYIVVPNEKNFNIGLSHGILNYSFLTAVSNSFQQKNVNKTILETRKELKNIFQKIDSSGKKFNTKLYISCITDCIMEGKIDNDLVILEIMQYYKDLPNLSELCLSDTCGSLKFEDYKYIVDNCIYFGLPPSKISVHLHIDKKNIEEIKNIIYYSLNNDINKFDVSVIETGGCSMTMPKSSLLPNMSYELLNSILKSYTNKE